MLILNNKRENIIDNHFNCSVARQIDILCRSNSEMKQLAFRHISPYYVILPCKRAVPQLPWRVYAKKCIIIWIDYFFLLFTIYMYGDFHREVYYWEYLLYTCIAKIARYMYFSIFMYVYNNRFFKDQFEINIGSWAKFCPSGTPRHNFLSLALPVLFVWLWSDTLSWPFLSISETNKLHHAFAVH